MMNQKDKQLLEIAKEKLRWYTMEASDEEFDAETVDALVNLVSALEAFDGENDAEVSVEQRTEERTEARDSKNVEERDRAGLEEKALQEKQFLKDFQDYCDLRLEDDAERKHISIKKERKEKKSLLTFRGNRIAAIITAACIFILIAVFSSLGIVNAGENQGFFHWLRRDGEGTKVVTVPSDVGFGVGEKVQYSKLEEVPEKERQYLVEIEKFSTLQGFVLQNIEIRDLQMSQRISEKFVMENQEDITVEIGVFIREEDVSITWEQYDDYKFLHSDVIGVYQQDIYFREKDSGEKEYMLVFYEENRKYFAFSNCGLDKLKDISEEYAKIVFE